MKKALVMGLCLLATCMAQALTPETRAQAESALEKGFAYLRAEQSPDGSWSDRRFPGMSALALWAMARAGRPENAATAEKTEAYLASCAQPDGGIYVPIPNRRGGGLGNYNTSLCMVALHTSGKGKYDELVRKARAYIASTQVETEGLHEGGFGYDKSSPRVYTDLNNTFYALDAMRLTQSVEEGRAAGEKHVDVDWEAAKKYILSMQETEGEDAGGFVYTREVPRARGAGEVPKLRSYGSMTYAGLLSMLHCQLTKADPKVRSTMDYLGKHWSLEENPGQGNQGLYFYYEILARALSAAEVEKLVLEDGTEVDWKEALAKALIPRQADDGSWVNESNRFWEADPVLSTSYALLTLTYLLE